MLMQIDGTFVVAFVSFLIFLFLIKVILYQPISFIKNKRENYLRQNNLLIDEQIQKAKALLDEKEQKLKETKKEANEQFANEIEAVKKLSLNSLNQAQTEANKLIETNKNKLDKQVVIIQNEIKEEMNSIITSIVSKVLRQNIEIKADDDKINKYLNIG